MINPDNAKHAPWALPLTPAWDEAIDAYIAHRRRGAASPESLVQYQTALGHLGRRMPVGPWVVTADHLVRYVDAQVWKPQTKRIRRQAIKDFYGWAVAAGHRTDTPVTQVSWPPVKPTKPRPRPAPDAIYYAALAAAPPREALMLRLAAELGLRRAEVAVVHSDDVLDDWDGGGHSLLVHGKGAKDRVLPMPASLADAVRAHPRGYLFPGDYGGHLSPRWVGRRIADIIPAGFTMHTLRHRFGTQIFAATGDLTAAQEALGHESPVTTPGYVDFDRSRRRAAVETVAAGNRYRRAS